MEKQIFKLSWVVYLKQIIVYFIVAFIIMALKSFIGSLAYILVVLWTIYLAIQIFANYVVKIYVDEQGVWIFSGIFPWNKGTYGLNWRDISDASYQTGFLSWALRSYTVTVGHRYTRDSHLVFANVANGKHLVYLINDCIKANNLY